MVITMIIYVDVLIITNFIITYFLLIASAVLSGYTYNRKKIALAAVAGAVCCMYIFIQQESFVADMLIKLFSLVICSSIAYGFVNIRKTAIQSICFAFLNMLLTGIVIAVSFKSTKIYENNMFYYFSINPVILVLFSLAIYLTITMFEFFKNKISPQQIYCIDIFFSNFSITGICAFYDSGFKVKDIISNKDIIIVEFRKVEEYLPLALKNDICNFFREDYENIREKFIPVFFSTISGKGMIPAIKAEYILTEGKKTENIIVGFSENTLGEDIQAIFGTDIKKQL